MVALRRSALRDRPQREKASRGTRATVFDEFPIKVYVPLDACKFSMEQLAGGGSTRKTPAGRAGFGRKCGAGKAATEASIPLCAGRMPSAEAAPAGMAGCPLRDSGKSRTLHAQAHAQTCSAGGHGQPPPTTYAPPPAARSTAHERAEHRDLFLDPRDVEAAVESLYVDELKPCGRILRKRVAERLAAAGAWAHEDVALPDVGARVLRGVCDGSPRLRVEDEEGGDWSAHFVGRAPQFVDVYSPVDSYPQDLWAAATSYFKALGGSPDMYLPGGRYLCAQVLASRGLPFLVGRSLGQVCHIVQLAISQKKLLGYLNGSVVPYGHSQSMVKDNCAVWMRPAAPAGAPTLPLATWDVARDCLRKMLESTRPCGGLGVVPLSNVKRLFRSRFHIELSETMLGHAKLSDLLQSSGFRDVCKVHLEGNGYVVVQVQPPADSTMKPAGAGTDATAGTATEAGDTADAEKEQQPARVRCRPAPLCLEMVDPNRAAKQPASAPPAPTTSAPTTTGAPAAAASVGVPSLWLEGDGSAAFAGEPRSQPLPAAPVLSFPATPTPVPSPAYHQEPLLPRGPPGTPMKVVAALFRRAAPAAESLLDPSPTAGPGTAAAVAGQGAAGEGGAAQPVPVPPVPPPGGYYVAGEGLAPQPSGIAAASTSPDHSDGWMSPLFRVGDGSVRNTFIDGGPPPLTPQAGMRRRSLSLPKDVGSHKHAWEEAPCRGRALQPGEGKHGGRGDSSDAAVPSSCSSPASSGIPATPKSLSSPAWIRQQMRNGDASFASSTVPVIHLADFV